jgi:hypothetical protein
MSKVFYGSGEQCAPCWRRSTYTRAHGITWDGITREVVQDDRLEPVRSEAVREELPS